MRAAAASMYPSPPMPRSEERASGRRPPIYRYRKIDEREDDGGGGAAGTFIVVVARKEDTDGEAEATFPLLGDGSEIVFTVHTWLLYRSPIILTKSRFLP